MPPRVEAARQGGQQQQQGGGGIVQQLMRYGMMYYMFKNIFGFGNKPQSTNRDDQLWPKYQRGEVFDVAIYMHESSHFPSQHHGNTDYLIWEERGLPLAGQGIDLQKQITYRASEAVQQNGTLFMHVFFTRPGASPNPNSPDFKQGEFFHKIHPLVRYLPERKAEEGVSLLSKEGKEKLAADKQKQQQEGEGAAKEEEPPRRIVSYLKPNVTIEMVDVFTKFPEKQVPPHIRPHLDVDPFAKEYSPVVHFNDFWLLREHLVPMNETVKEVPMTVFLQTLAGWKWQLYLQVTQSFVMQQQMGMAKEGEEDDLKRVLLEGNPYFLALTFAVSLLHSVFDVFAFKNDIGFWKNKENLTGLSVRTIGINCFCQAVIFLYLLDNETSFVVLASSFVGTLIEFWKVTKAMDVSITWRGSIPIPTFREKSSYSKSETATHDAQAMKYLSWVLYPLLGGYAIYTLVYDKHKSWYSWVLSTMVGAVYAFGFITMCPQLYINYKLKSVAHLPWRQMSYKFLNTIIDDLFAFVIKMPLLHRLAVFRDDIVFVIFIYQRWIYRVDKTRVNEFGYTEAPPPPGVAAAAEGQLLEGEEAVAGGARRRRGAGQQQQQVEGDDGSEGVANGTDGEITAEQDSSSDAAASAVPEKKKDK